jgi:hypothetical protein
MALTTPTGIPSCGETVNVYDSWNSAMVVMSMEGVARDVKQWGELMVQWWGERRSFREGLPGALSVEFTYGWSERIAHVLLRHRKL